MDISRDPKFVCPACGHGRHKVVNTRPMSYWGSTDEGVWRERACLKCGWVIETTEQVVARRLKQNLARPNILGHS